MSKVTVWYMNESERLAYIEKYPIKPTKKPKRIDEANFHKKDFTWHGDKGAEARWGKG
jgi:hypothetical protein